MILVTGGAGFIGSHFVNSTDEDMVVIDKMTYAANRARLNGDVVVAEVQDREYMRFLFQENRPRAVVHFAAQTHVTSSIYWPEEFVEDNVEGTFCLLQEALAYWQEHKEFRFIHVSTDEVFGNLGPSEKPFTENSPYRPSTPYAATKAAADHLVRSYHMTYGFPSMIVHPTNNFGPGQHPEKLIPLMVELAKNGQDLPVHGDGKGTRDWIHVDDTCNAIRLVLEKGEVGESYCVGARNEKTVLDVVTEIRDRLNSKSQIRYVEDRPGNDRRYAVNPEKIESIGFSPKRKFEIPL